LSRCCLLVLRILKTKSNTWVVAEADNNSDSEVNNHAATNGSIVPQKEAPRNDEIIPVPTPPPEPPQTIFVPPLPKSQPKDEWKTPLRGYGNKKLGAVPDLGSSPKKKPEAAQPKKLRYAET